MLVYLFFVETKRAWTIFQNKSNGKQRTVVSWYDPFPNPIRRFAPHMALARARPHGYSEVLYRHMGLDFDIDFDKKHRVCRRR